MTLIPAVELASKNKASHPNESPEYREARNALLAEEIELRRHIERVSAMRRALPLGGEVAGDFVFETEAGSVSLSEIFGDKKTLVLYSMMYGPQRKAPCPMCSSMLASWNGAAPNIAERVSLVVTARSPIERILALNTERRWPNLRMVSDATGNYTRTYVSAEDADMPGLNIFTRVGGKIRHFWAGETSGEMADPGQDPRSAPEVDPLWTMLDLTPEGRGADWYPKLHDAKPL